MIEQIFSVYLDGLLAHLDVIEQGREVRYVIQLDGTRQKVTLIREVYEAGEMAPFVGFLGYRATADVSILQSVQHENGLVAAAIERSIRELSLNELKDDPAIPHHLLWAVRGMWGIPLEFGRVTFAVPSPREVGEAAIGKGELEPLTPVPRSESPRRSRK